MQAGHNRDFVYVILIKLKFEACKKRLGDECGWWDAIFVLIHALTSISTITLTCRQLIGRT